MALLHGRPCEDRGKFHDALVHGLLGAAGDPRVLWQDLAHDTRYGGFRDGVLFSWF